MINEPLVSVVVTVFNKRLFIHETIDSVLNQSFTKFELIVIDDASTDQSLSQIKTLNDSRIKIHEFDKNMGVEFARNYGAKQANSNLLVFLDGDDLFTPTKLSQQVALFESNSDLAICGTWTIHISECGENLGDFRPPVHSDQIKFSMHFKNPFINSSVMVRRELFESVGGFLEGKEPGFAEDYDLWLRLVDLGQAHNIPSMLTVYRDSKSGRSQNLISNPTESSRQIRGNYLQTKLGSFCERSEIDKILHLIDHTRATHRILLSEIWSINATYREIANRISKDFKSEQIKYQKRYFYLRLLTGIIFQSSPFFISNKYLRFKSNIKRSHFLYRLTIRVSNFVHGLTGKNL